MFYFISLGFDIEKIYMYLSRERYQTIGLSQIPATLTNMNE